MKYFYTKAFLSDCADCGKMNFYRTYKLDADFIFFASDSHAYCGACIEKYEESDPDWAIGLFSKERPEHYCEV